MPSRSRGGAGGRKGARRAYLCEGVESVASVTSNARAQAAARDATSPDDGGDRILEFANGRDRHELSIARHGR